MKIAQNTIDDLQVLAHHAETTNTNLSFTSNQIWEIRRIILDLMGKIIDLQNSQENLNEEEIPYVGILQNANLVSLGCAIWETDEEFIKYKKIILSTVRAMEKRNQTK